MNIKRFVMLYIPAMIAFCGLFAVNVFAADTSAVSEKDANVSLFYAAVFVLSLLLFFVYSLWSKRRERMFVLLYGCIAVANLGYFLISVANTLPQGLWANRISYFGSAYSVLIMVIIISEICGVDLGKSRKGLFVFFTSVAFLFAATGGWLNIYYREVSLEVINGASRLVKHYAPLHFLYTVYVLAYFAIMVYMVLYSRKKGRIATTNYAVFLVAVVLCNIAVWGVEQLVDIEFEFLSISYVATGVFMQIMRCVISDYNELEEKFSHAEAFPAEEAVSMPALPPDIEDLFEGFKERVITLTPSERTVLQNIIDGYDLEEIADRLFISVNTVRKHNTNLKRKLELSSKEELGLYIDLFRRAGRLDEIIYMQ